MTEKIRIYTADICTLLDRDNFDKIYSSVSEQRRFKTDRMRFLKGKCQSLGVEWLLKYACREFGIDFNREKLTTDIHGKPVFAENPVYFNLSHSENRVMCAMSTCPVGCDVEMLRTAEKKLAKRFFSDEENRMLEACESDADWNALFFRLWTLKESFQKCTGLGFQLPLDAFSVCITESGIEVKQNVSQKRYLFSEKNMTDGYQYAWCVQTDTGADAIDTLWENISIDF